VAAQADASSGLCALSIQVGTSDQKEQAPPSFAGHYGMAADLIRLAGQRAFFLIEQQAFLDGSHHFLNAQKHRTLQGIMPGIVEAVLQAFLWRNLTPSDPIRAAIRAATPCGWV
jgi:hypothetical protein